MSKAFDIIHLRRMNALCSVGCDRSCYLRARTRALRQIFAVCRVNALCHRRNVVKFALFSFLQSETPYAIDERTANRYEVKRTELC